MAQFVKLDEGSLINLDHVVRLHPRHRSNRVDFVTGAHLLLGDADAEKIHDSLLPKPVAKRSKTQK